MSIPRIIILKLHSVSSSALLRGALFNALRLAVKPLFAPYISPKLRRKGLELASLSTLNARGLKPEQVKLQGVPSLRYGPAKNGTAVLYLHGGAYTAGSPKTHASLTSHLAQTSGATVFVPDYRLAPEHPFPAALEDACFCYQALLEQGFDPTHITVAGDSAGGGLTLSLLLHLKAEQIPLPKGMILLSPWADLTHPNAQAPNQPQDAMLTWEGLNAAAKGYAGNEPLTQTGISPALGDATGLPPALIIVGTEEILLADVKSLTSKLKQQGVATELAIYEKMWHVFPLHARILKEADHAINTMASFILN